MLGVVNQWLKRTGVAAQEGAEAAHEIFTPHHLEEELTEDEAKAYKALRKKNKEARKAQAAALLGGGRKKDRAVPYQDFAAFKQYQAMQQAQLADYSGGEGVGPSMVPYSGSSGGSFGGSGSNLNKMRFPCKACGKLGHWVQDGLCKPEDVAAEMARKYAYSQQTGSGTSGTSGMKLISGNLVMKLSVVVKRIGKNIGKSRMFVLDFIAEILVCISMYWYIE